MRLAAKVIETLNAKVFFNQSSEKNHWDR